MRSTPQSGTLRRPLVTGEQLYEELCAAAAKAGRSLRSFAEPLLPDSWKIEQLRIARHPTPATVLRVRALIAGESLPPRAGDRFALTRVAAEAAGQPASQRSVREASSLAVQNANKARIEEMRRLTELAHVQRRPGQTIADCVREMRRAARG